MNKDIFFKKKKFAGRRDLRFPDGAHQGGPEPGRRDRQRGLENIELFMCIFIELLFAKPGDGVLGRRGRAPGQRPAPAGEHHVRREKFQFFFVVPAMLYALRES